VLTVDNCGAGRARKAEFASVVKLKVPEQLSAELFRYS
jgi:hypothetical protein